jgi:cytochrome c553
MTDNSSERPAADLDRKWRLASGGAVLGVLTVGILCGFVILPVIQGYQAGIDPYTAICRALGITAGSPLARQPSSDSPAQPVSQVAWTPAVLRGLSASNNDLGKTVASETCAACHGENGVSADPAQFPNMAAQSSAAIYKQLNDYKSGARVNEIMQGVTAQLTQEQLVAVATFYSQVEAPRWDRTWVQSATQEAEKLALTGDSARGLPACESCHSPRAGGPIETPVLFGQSREYFSAQLLAFKKGERKNDVYARMRSVAAKLSDEEIQSLSQFYWERR